MCLLLWRMGIRQDEARCENKENRGDTGCAVDIKKKKLLVKKKSRLKEGIPGLKLSGTCVYCRIMWKNRSRSCRGDWEIRVQTNLLACEANKALKTTQASACWAAPTSLISDIQSLLHPKCTVCLYIYVQKCTEIWMEHSENQGLSTMKPKS